MCIYMINVYIWRHLRSDIARAFRIKQFQNWMAMVKVAFFTRFSAYPGSRVAATLLNMFPFFQAVRI